MTVTRFIRKSVENAAKRVGILAIPEWRMESYLLANRLKRIVHEYQIDCIFDVGANVGQYRDFLRGQVEYMGLIISFEPDPDNYQKLAERAFADKNWIVFDSALGKEEAQLDFNIMKSSVFNSFLEPSNDETAQFKDPNSVVKTIKIHTQRLDQIFQTLKDTYQFKNMFLKLDTQGFDLDVFEGAEGCLSEIRGVQTEISVMPIYKDMPTFEHSIQAFKAKGFEVSGMYSLSESRFPHAVEFDCIYLPR